MEGGAIDWVRRTIDSQGAKPAASRPRSGDPPEAIKTFIDQGVECTGNLRLKVSARIDGEFKGSVETEANLIIGETAGVEASLKGREIVISGAVVGDVTASRSLVVRAGGRLHGDVETPSLVIERGAVFNGRSTMTRPQEALHAGQHADEGAKPNASRPAGAPTPSTSAPA